MDLPEKLTEEMEAFIHLLARAFARAGGDENPHVFAGVVVEHAKNEVEAENATKNDTTPLLTNDTPALVPSDPAAPVVAVSTVEPAVVPVEPVPPAAEVPTAPQSEHPAE